MDPELIMVSAVRDGLLKEILLNDRLSKVSLGSDDMTQRFQQKMEQAYSHIYALHQLYGTMDSTLCQFDSFFKKYLLNNFEKFLTDLDKIEEVLAPSSALEN